MQQHSYRFKNDKGQACGLATMPSKRVFMYLPALPYSTKDENAKLWINWEVNREFAAETLRKYRKAATRA